MSDNRYFPSIPVKKLKTDILSTDSTFKLRDIKWYTGSDATDVSLSSTIFGTGLVGYGVFEPNTPRQEFFTFDPTNMAVATTTGLTILSRGLPWGSDYTTQATSRKFNHPSGSQVVLSTNAPAFYDQFLNKANDESPTGIFTFSESAMPRISTAHTYGAGEEEYLATKRYVDGVVTGGAADANTTTKGLVEEATAAELAAGTAAGGTAARLFANPSTIATQIQSGSWVYGLEDGSGADDAYTWTTTPVTTAYAVPSLRVVKFTVANTGACTGNENSIGALAIKKYASGALADLETGDIVAGFFGLIYYDGTFLVLLNPGASMPTTALLSEMATFFGLTAMTGTEAETLRAGQTSNADALHMHTSIGMDAGSFAGGSIHIPTILSDGQIVAAGGNFGGARLWKRPSSLEFQTGTTVNNLMTARTDGVDLVAAAVGEDGLFGTTGTGAPTLATSWTAVIRFRFGIVPATTDNFFIGFAEDADTLDASGALPTTSRHCGYQYNGTNWRITNGDNTTQTTTNVATPSTGWHELKIVRVTATSIAFYIDGTLLGTHTTNLPTQGPLLFFMEHVNGAGVTKTIELSRYIDMYVATT